MKRTVRIPSVTLEGGGGGKNYRSTIMGLKAMKLTQAQIDQFDEDGFLVLPNLFSAEEVAEIRAAMTRVFDQDDEANLRERKSGAVRSAMSLHLRDETFANLIRHPRFVEPAQQLRGEHLYAQQVKINVKAAYEGEVWQWHQDFASHHNDDGVPEPLALNLHILLDDVNEFNGPLYFFKGSHKEGPIATWHDTETTSFKLWVCEREGVEKVAQKYPLVSATGGAGTALIFGDCLVHGSPPNMSPMNRSIFSLILNPVGNAFTKHARKEQYHHRDLTPVQAVADDCLLQRADA